MWADVQETFLIVLGPFINDILLPVFVAAGVIIAILTPFSRFWRPYLKVDIVKDRRKR